ncbi:MAG: transcription termination/antitermination protein NusA [Chloroflexota bacterium]|nr:MAG: transcription termination/antitermination protein NusA [Chloroflexota bacterium]
MIIMIKSEFMAAVNQVCSERGIDPEVVFETLKHAMLAAYRKDYGEAENLEVKIDKENGAVTILREGEDITPPGFGRIAAQTAKQVILQGVREAEKEAILDEFQSKVGTVISGMLQRREGRDWVVDLGRTVGVLPPSEQVFSEGYRNNQRLRFFVKEIRQVGNKQQIIVSRSDPELVRGLFELEIPEVNLGAVEVKAIAREAGQRSKVAVASAQEGVDPVGSCVGQRGVRVQAVTDELSGERIDVILWNEDPAKFVSAALSPAEVAQIKIDEEEKTALVKVPDDQISLAIGKEGQNARLAAKLTGYRIDIHGVSEKPISPKDETAKVPEKVISRLKKAGVSWEEAKKMSADQLLSLPGVGKKTVEEIEKLASQQEKESSSTNGL